jgi:hypothetical protein
MENLGLAWLLANAVDPLDLAVACDVDTIEAQAIDPVAYWETSAFEILDDEIDWLDRDGQPQATPIAVRCGHMPSAYED